MLWSKAHVFLSLVWSEHLLEELFPFFEATILFYVRYQVSALGPIDLLVAVQVPVENQVGKAGCFLVDTCESTFLLIDDALLEFVEGFLVQSVVVEVVNEIEDPQLQEDWVDFLTLDEESDSDGASYLFQFAPHLVAQILVRAELIVNFLVEYGCEYLEVA